MIRCLPVFKKKKKNSSRSLEDETFGNTQGIKVLGADEEMKKENPKSSNVTQIFHFQSSNLQKLMEKHKKVQRHGTGTLVLFPFIVVLGEQKTHWKCSPSFLTVDTSSCGKKIKRHSLTRLLPSRNLNMLFLKTLVRKFVRQTVSTVFKFVSEK